MELRSSALKSIQNNIDSIRSDYKNQRIDEKKLVNEVKKISAELQSQIIQANSKINMAKFPRASKAYSHESLQLSELTKFRAYMLMDKPISLIKSEIAKENEAGNYEFSFTLMELIFASNRSDGDKASLSNTYHQLKEVTKVDRYEDEKKQAEVLQVHTNAIINFEGTPDLLSKSEMEMAHAELKYVRQAESSSKPEFLKFREAQGIDTSV